MSKLNAKQEAFCLHYAKTGNASESYRLAGYDCKSVSGTGSSARRLLLTAKIQNRLAELSAEAAEERPEKIAGIREIQERLTSILRGELQEEQIVVEGCGDGVSQATIVKRQPQLKDIIKAGETLGKMQGAFDNRVQLEMTIPVFGGEDSLAD